MSNVASTLRRLGLQPDEISRRAEIPLARVTALMEGAPASLAELRSLSKSLKIALSAFSSSESRLLEKTLIQFRSTKSSGAPDITVQRAEQFVDGALRILPSRNSVPEWIKAFSVKDETYPEAQRLADAFRRNFYAERIDDPALDLADVLTTQAGVIIGRLQQSKYEGASLIAGGYPFVLISTRFPARMLFTLAHELGHIIAHHNDNSHPIFEGASQIGFGKRRSLREKFVDAFASILLLPASSVGTALATIRKHYAITADAIGDIEILLLARFFGVSFEVAARRCEDLNLLPQGGAHSLLDEIHRNFGNPERRADAVGLPSRPQIVIPNVSKTLMRAIIEKIDAGEISLGWAANSFSLSVDDIHAAHAEFSRELRH